MIKKGGFVDKGITKSSVIFRDEVNFEEFEKRSKEFGKMRAKDM